MSVERAAPVSDVRVWLSRVQADEAGQLLDDGASDKAVLIVALDPARRAVTLEGGRSWVGAFGS